MLQSIIPDFLCIKGKILLFISSGSSLVLYIKDYNLVVMSVEPKYKKVMQNFWVGQVFFFF